VSDADADADADAAVVVGAAPVAPAPFPWQAGLVTALMAERRRFPHALLLTGPPGIGKRTLALCVARALLCETPRADGDACGTCASCRYAAAGQHPDLRLVEPVSVDEEGTVTPQEWIQVDAIRGVIDWAQLTSHRGVAKVAVIVPAERMNVAAANALLKTLEEPPPDTYLILVTAAPGRLPATVRSRCRVVPAPRPTRAAARDWLVAQGIAATAADALLAQAGGAPLVAQTLADPAHQAERAAWLAGLATPSRLSPAVLAERIDAAPRDERRERLAHAIDWMAGWCADLAHLQAGAPPRRNADHAGPLTRLAPSVAPIALFRYHRALLRQRGLVAHPLTPRLVAESLLTEYRSLFR